MVRRDWNGMKQKSRRKWHSKLSQMDLGIHFALFFPPSLMSNMLAACLQRLPSVANFYHQAVASGPFTAFHAVATGCLDSSA